jgi:hypothetical protein
MKPRFFDELAQHFAPDLLTVPQHIANWIKTTSAEVAFGRGSSNGSIGAAFKRQGSRFLAPQLWTSGVISLNFDYMTAPFDKPKVRQGWVDRVRAVQGITLSSDAGNKRPSIRLSAISPIFDSCARRERSKLL